MDLLGPFKVHIGSKAFESFAAFESALDDFQKVDLLRVNLMCRPLEHGTPKLMS